MKPHIVPLRPTGDASEWLVRTNGTLRVIRIGTLESLFAGGRWKALALRLA